MVAECWERLPTKFPDVELDLFCVMPNHFHGILVMVRSAGAHTGAPLPSLSTVLQWFKTMTTNAYMRGVREQNWESFHGKLWQRSFHDHIIRSEESLNMLRAYTQQNPARWEADEFYK
jgi:REP element-mobilizing transposase RayT